MPEQIEVTVDAKGAPILAGLPPEVAAQLSTPEAQAQILKLYRQSHPKTGRREVRAEIQKTHRVICDPGNQRIITGKPANMSAREWRTARKKVSRDLTKQTLKQQRQERAQQAQMIAAARPWVL